MKRGPRPCPPQFMTAADTTPTFTECSCVPGAELPLDRFRDLMRWMHWFQRTQAAASSFPRDTQLIANV